MPQFNIRLEDDLISAIKRRARQEGISTSDLCRNALEQYLSSGSIPAIPSTANSAIQHEAIQDISAIPGGAKLLARVTALEEAIGLLQQSQADDRGDNSQIAEFEPEIGGVSDREGEPTEPATTQAETVGTTEEIASLLGMARGTLSAAKSRGKLPVRGNGWVATPTGERQGNRSEMWRAVRE